jgi:hypothetical protein
MTAWPDTLPACVLDDGYNEQQEVNVAEFAAEVGPPLRRRRSSISTSLIEHLLILDADQVQILLDFYRDDLKDGALPFTRTHPRDQVTEGCFIFTKPPVFTSIAPYWRAAISLRSLP